MSRLHALSTNPTAAVPAVKAAIRGFRASETSARDLISTIWNILDRNLEHTASIVNAFVDLLDEEEKKQDLLSSWKGFAIEVSILHPKRYTILSIPSLQQRRQFPDLIPTAVGGGYAAITTGRVLNAKNSTARRSSQQSSRQVWDRVAQAAGSSSSSLSQAPALRPPDRFPSLQTPVARPAPAPVFRQGQRNTPWSASSGSGFRPPSSSSAQTGDPRNQGPSSRPGSGPSTPRPPPPKLSNSLFPELPTSASARQKAPVSGNVSLRNILGVTAPPVPAWQAGSNTAAVAQTTASAGGADVDTDTVGSEEGQGKGKKSKGKQKQTLFTLGSFPT